MNNEKHEKAQQLADSIILTLDKPEVESHFSKNYFPKEQLEPILEGIRRDCDWSNRDGKFVDFFRTTNIGGIDQTAFIYEYYLKCDSIRVILTYDMEKKLPELMGFHWESLEVENNMIIDPAKQLKNR